MTDNDNVRPAIANRDTGRLQRRLARKIRDDLSEYSDEKFWSYVHDAPVAASHADAKAKDKLKDAYASLTELMKQEGLL